MTYSDKLFSISAILIIILLVSAVLGLFSAFGVSAQTGSGFVLVDALSGVVLDGDNKDMRLEEASTTKVMTALVAIRKLDPSDIVTVKRESVGIEGSSIYLKEGERISVKTLLYGLMLRSGNDAAHALAVAACGSEEKFVEAMNAEAKRLGLVNTHFCNPHGLHADGHYTSAYDLAMITREAYREPLFAEIVASKSYRSDDPRESEAHVFYNKNKLLSTLDGANGVKTGYTTASGKCFVGGAKRGGMQLICVVLNRGDMWQKAADLLEYGFERYEPTLVGRSDVPLFDYEYGGERIQLRLAEDVVLPTEKGERAELGWEFVPVEEVEKGFAAGDTVGFVRFWQGNRLIFEAKTVTIKAISNKGATSLRGLAAEDTIDWKGLTSISPLAASPREGAPTY